MTAPEISVVICTHNRMHVLPKAMDSVLAQEDVDLELIVVDDGSTDATRDVVLGVADPRVRLVSRANGGLSAARNSGAGASMGALLMFLDDDDELLPGALERVVRTSTETSAGVVTWGADVVDATGRVVDQLRPHDLGPAFEDYRALFRAGTFAVDRVLYDEVGGFDADLRANHQTEFSLRLLPICRERGIDVAAIDLPLTRILRRDADRRARNDPERLLVATERIIGRHREQLARAPGLLADYLATAGVAAVRLGRSRDGRRLFGEAAAVATVPTQVWKNRGRQLLTTCPPLARRAWRIDAYAGLGDRQPNPLVLYRGPWQGRRVRFLLDAVSALHGDVDFVWLNPRFEAGADRGWTRSLPRERPFLRHVEEIDGNVRSVPRAVVALARRARRGRVVYAIGFTALPFARVTRPRRLVWAVNGIPEERLLHSRSARSRAAVELSWLAARAGRRPDAAVVVSGPMGEYVSRRLGPVPWAKAPTSVDVDVFDRPPAKERPYFTYVGSGAPWQGIPLLARIWGEIARLDPSTRFRVVSRDERAAALLGSVPDGSGEIVPANGPDQVAALLAEAKLAFLVREPDIVNETSFPTKFGEYLAAGVPVVTTEIGWEISEYVRASQCGLLVDPDAAPAVVAELILEYAGSLADDLDLDARCRAAAHQLSRSVWLESLVTRLRELS